MPDNLLANAPWPDEAIASEVKHFVALDFLQRRHQVNSDRRVDGTPELPESVTLELGADNMIISVDDNPLERAEVAANCPELTTVQFSKSAQEIPEFRYHHWKFDAAAVANDDQKRTRFDQEQLAHDMYREQAPTPNELLNNLDSRIGIDQLVDADAPRVAQLTQHSNRFNALVRQSNELTEAFKQLGETSLFAVPKVTQHESQ